MLGTFGKTYKQVLELLPKPLKEKWWKIQLLFVAAGFFDLFGLAAFIPVLTAITNPDILNSQIFLWLKSLFNFQSNDQFILALFVGAVLVFCFRSVFLVFSQWVQNKFVFQVSEYIGKKTYEYYLGMGYQEFSRKNSVEVIRELALSPQYFGRFLIMPLLLLTSEFLIIFLMIIAIAAYDFKIFLLLLGIISPLAYFFQFFVKKKMKALGEHQNALAAINYANSKRGINGYIDVRLRNKESILVDDYLRSVKKLNKTSVIVSTLSIVPSKMFELATVFGLLMIFVYGAFIMGQPSVIIPLITVYVAAGYRIIPSLGRIMPASMQLEQYSFLFNIYKPPLQSTTPLFHHKHEKVMFEQEIKMENLYFKFSNKEAYILKEFNLSFLKGEIVGLIGKSGSGKTTVVNLLTGFLKPEKGCLKVDGMEINCSNVGAWMAQISYVQQNPYLEKGSLASNIAFLEKSPDPVRLQKAIEAASLSDFIAGRDPNKIWIEEDGKNLSGGQKQRVIIARALYNNSQLIILDEATSALDNETEREVNETVKKLKGTGVTIVIIAHRYSTLIHADRIIELQPGHKIIETTYQKMMHGKTGYIAESLS